MTQVARSITLLLLLVPLPLPAGGWLPVADPPRVGPAAYTQIAPRLASNGVDYLAAWTTESPDGGSHVYAAAVRSDGTVDGTIARQLDTNAARARGVSLTPGRDGYLAAWKSEKGLSAAITDSFGRIERQVTTPNEDEHEADTLSAWDGASYLVVTGSTNAFVGMALDNNCEILEADIPLGERSGASALTAERDGFLFLAARRVPGVSPHRDDIYGIRITSGGAPGEPFLVRSVASAVSGLAVAFDGFRDIIVWSDEFGLWTTSLDPKTNTTGPSRQLVPNARRVSRVVIAGGRTWIAYSQTVIAVDAAGNVTRQPFYPDIASNGSSVLGFNGVEGRFLAPAVTEPFVVAKSQTDQQHGNLAGDGQNLIAVWDEEIDGKRQIFSGRYDAQRTLRTASGIQVTRSGDNIAPAVAFNGRDYLVAWIRTKDGKRELAARRLSTDGALFDAEDLVLGDATGANPAVASDGSNWLVMWTARVPAMPCSGFSYATRLFAARVSPGGTILDPSGLSVAPQLPTSPYNIDVAWTGSNYVVAWEARCDGWHGLSVAGIEAAFISSDLSSVATATLALNSAARPRVVPGPDRSLIAWQGAGGINVRIVPNAPPPIPSRRHAARTATAPPRTFLGDLVAAVRTRNGELAILHKMMVPWATAYLGMFETVVNADGTLSASRYLFIVEPNEIFMGRVAQLGTSRFLSAARFDPAAGAQRMWLRELD
jgi:hypothetical protein